MAPHRNRQLGCFPLKIPEDNVTTAPGSSYPIESSPSSDGPPGGSSAPPQNGRKLIHMVTNLDHRPGASLQPFAARAVAAHQSRREKHKADYEEVNRSTALWALATLDPNFRRAFVESGLDVGGLAKDIGIPPDPPVPVDVDDASLHEIFASAWEEYLESLTPGRPIEALDVALAMLKSAGPDAKGLFPGRAKRFGLDVPKATQTFQWKVDTGWWPWEKRVDARPQSDDITGPDQLGREILAAHADAALGTLLGYGRAAEPVPNDLGVQTRPAVLHIDGRWGSGKSHLVSIMLDPTKSGEAASERRIRHPLVVNYDAWKESTVTPEWWSLGAQIVQAVHRERSLAGRWAMTLVGLASRIGRSRALLIGLIVGLAFAAIFLSNAEAGQTLTKLAGAIGAFVTIGIVAGQALFWTAPAFGRLHLSSSDSVLASVATEVARVRRWGPRTTDLQRPTDTLCATCVVLAATLATIAIADTWRWSWTTPLRAGGSLWWLPSTLAGGCAALLWWACWRQRDPASAPDPDSATTVVRFLVALTAFVIVSELTLAGQFSPWSRAGAGSAVALLAFACWGLLAHVSTYPRRPMMVLIDDLDRCRANRVTKLIETVHTLLRHNAAPTGIASRRRTPAPLAIVVIGDGRWIRQAFVTDFEDFSALGSEVHDLGADFVQKVFDHTVLVPSLSTAQRLIFTRLATESSGRGKDIALTGTTSSGPPDSDGSGTTAGDGAGPATHGPRSAETIKKIAEEQERAMSDVDIVRDQLLTDFANVMPANPRLIKKTVFALLMLRALKDSTQHQEDDNAVARAAILSVRFPTLASDIISDTRSANRISGSAPWTRPDIRELLGSGQPITVPVAKHVESVARCLGRTHPFDADAEPPAHLC
jgi:hypothetical protein